MNSPLKTLRLQKGLTQAELANMLGIVQSTLSGWETGKFEIDNASLLKLSDIFGVSTDLILRNATSFDAPKSTGGKWIPVLGTIAAGIPVEAIEDITGWEEINPNMANTGEFFALRVKGQSMEPKFSEGDIVIVKHQPDVDTGDVAVVIINGEDATLKKIKKSPEGIMLIPSNRAFEPKYFTNKEIETLPVTILGKVVELRAKF